MGRKAYADATELLITADCGGSNSNRSRLQAPGSRLQAPGSRLQALEGRASTIRRPYLAHDRRLALPAGYFEVELDRAPSLLPHHPKLARPAARRPRDRHQADRRHKNDDRPARQSKARHPLVAPWRQGQRDRDGCTSPGRGGLSWRMELHARSKVICESVIN